MRAPVPVAVSERAALDRSFIHGVAWTSVATWGGQLLRWASTFVVLRQLTGDDYGLVGLAELVLGVVMMLSEFGLGAAIVRYRTLTDDQIAQFQGLSIGLGAAAMSVAVAGAIPMSVLMAEPRLPTVILVMSTAFLVNAFRTVPWAILQRDLRFRRLAAIDLAQTVAMAATSALLAILGAGYWALVAAILGGSLVSTGLVVLHHRVPVRWPRLRTIREPFEFSSHTIVTRLAWYGYSNVDRLIIGWRLGTASVGVYIIAWMLASLPVEKITALVGRVTPSLFSAVQHDLAEVRRYLVRITAGIAMVTFPAAVGLALVAPELVPVVAGPGWEGAIVPLQILALLATIRSVDPPVQQVLAAIGEARMNTANALLILVVLPVAQVLATPWGLTGVALAWLGVAPLLLGRLLLQACRRIELPLREYVAAIWPAVSGCLVMALMVAVVDRVALASAPPVAALAAKIAAGAAAYIGAVLALHGSHVRMIRGVFAQLRNA